MTIFILKKDGCPNQYFKETPEGMEIGINLDKLSKVSFKFAQMKWDGLINNGYKRE